MDSLKAYVAHSKAGGPAGEMTVRLCLEEALQHFGFDIDVADSDAAFFRFARDDIDKYALIILDPWTFVDPGFVPRPFLLGREDRVFLLDFFGSERASHGLKISPKQILTPFPTPWNTFLGFYKEPFAAEAAVAKKPQGVVWGKKPDYLHKRRELLLALAEVAELHTTVTEDRAGSSQLPRHPNIVYDGHQTPEGWMRLLRESRFMLGLGDPLIGPSAIDAVAAGTVFINPVLKPPKLKIYHSQHPFMHEYVGEPYVCTVSLDDIAGTRDCVRAALRKDLQPMVPSQLHKGAYFRRVGEIFAAFLPAQ